MKQKTEVAHFTGAHSDRYRSMTGYENEQLEEIKAWENKKPGLASKALDSVLAPINRAAMKIIPRKAIEQALNASDSLAKKLTDKDDILRDGKVSKIIDLRSKDLHLSDSLANSVHNWAIAIATAEGGAAGAAGNANVLPGGFAAFAAAMVADISSIITLALRTVHKIGLCYGYELDETDNKERLFALGVIAAAGASTVDEKNLYLIALRQVAVFANKTTWKKMGEMAGEKGAEAIIAKALLNIKAVAKTLDKNFTKKVVAKGVPIVGAALGATLNSSWITDVAWAARRSYQRRWLIDNGLIDENGNVIFQSSNAE